MKKETKALIEWIKAQIRIAAKLDDSYLITTDAISTHKSLEKDAEKFLDSLSEIESHLCRGGYIQDKNGTPCCDGNTILINAEFEATLKWIVPKGKNPDNMPHFGFQWKCDANIVDELPSFWIKKVTK